MRLTETETLFNASCILLVFAVAVVQIVREEGGDMPDSALPDNLKGQSHTDYPWGLRWVPRGWTAYKWGNPLMVFGSDGAKSGGSKAYPKPITGYGTWQLSRFPDGPWYAWYFAFTTKGGIHFRIGARWDDVDNYVEFPSIAIKKLNGR